MRESLKIVGHRDLIDEIQTNNILLFGNLHRYRNIEMILYIFVNNNPLLYTDLLGVDSPGCDGVPDFMEIECVRECCAAHDKCYDENDCSSSSWFFCGKLACIGCNLEVVGCILICPWPKDDQPDYYCAQCHVYFEKEDALLHAGHTTTKGKQ